MAIGQRIKFFRNLRNLTQKELGQNIGFSERAADVRIAQYESEKRIPKEDLTKSLASILDISPAALNVPDIDTYTGLMHTLFALEDIYGLKINKIDGELCISLNKHHKCYSSMFEMLNSWQEEKQKLIDDEITQEQYDQWRYTYPKSEIKRFKRDTDKFNSDKEKS